MCGWVSSLLPLEVLLNDAALGVLLHPLQILRALGDGVDVRGMYYWTLLDNFEWNAGYSIK